MHSRTIQIAAVVLLLLFASSYCAAECIVGPCHEVQADSTIPPCHPPAQDQQDQADSSESCLHPQFVVDTHQTASVVPVLLSLQHAEVLLLDARLTVPSRTLLVAARQELSPPPLLTLGLSTVLRV